MQKIGEKCVMALAIHAEASVGDLTYSRVRDDILNGRLTPGQKLKLDQIKSRYAVSISTLRETLNRLSSEGFVVAEGQKGFRVSPVSETNLREIADLRLLLECHALTLSFAAGDLEWEGRIVAAHHKLQSMERRMLESTGAEIPGWKHFDRDFHAALISACGSETLMRAHADICDKYLRYQMLALTFRGEISMREHEMLLNLALERDAEAAKKLLVTHIHGGVDYAVRAGHLE